MSDAPYRDELEAAHQRIAALESELIRASRGVEYRAPADAGLLDPHLLPEEEVLWVGGPDPRRKVIKGRHIGFVLGLVFFFFWLVAGMKRGMPPAFMVPAGSFLIFMGGITTYRAVRAIKDARASRYAITDRRVLLLEQKDEQVSVRALHLEPGLGVSLTLRGGGFGDLTLEPPGKEAITLPWLREPAAAHRLLTQLVDEQRALPAPGERRPGKPA